MDEKYLVQFITLLGTAVACILLAIQVWNDRITINSALIILLAVIIIFFIIGRIVLKTVRKFNREIEEKEKAAEAERLRQEFLENERANKEDNDDDESENEDEENITG